MMQGSTFHSYKHYIVHGKILVAEKKLVNLANHELFAKIFLTNIPHQYSSPIFTDTQKMHLAYELIVAYSSNFSSPIALLYGSPKFPPAKYFLYTVYFILSKAHTVYFEKQKNLQPDKQIRQSQRLVDTRWVCSYMPSVHCAILLM